MTRLEQDHIRSEHKTMNAALNEGMCFPATARSEQVFGSGADGFFTGDTGDYEIICVNQSGKSLREEVHHYIQPTQLVKVVYQLSRHKAGIERGLDRIYVRNSRNAFLRVSLPENIPPDTYRCYICLDSNIDKTRRLSCDHQIHIRCYSKVLKAKENRQDIKECQVCEILQGRVSTSSQHLECEYFAANNTGEDNRDPVLTSLAKRKLLTSLK